MFVSLLITIFVAIVAVLFASYNHEMININMFGTNIPGEAGLFIIIALGIGVLIGVVIMLPSLWKRSFMLTRQKRIINELEQTPPRKSSKKK